MDELTHPQPPSPSLLCLGGSFNPLHVGHLITARAAAEAGGFGGIRLVVAGDPPHKPRHPGLISAHHRLEMTRRAVAGADTRFHWLVDDREIRRAGPSYTVLTARELIESGSSPEPVDWLIGADLLPGLTQWHEARTLLQGSVVRFWVMRRGGFDINWSHLPPAVQSLRERVVEVPRIDISATTIRRRINARQSIRFLVPEVVDQYILDHNLYQGVQEAQDSRSAPGAKLEKSG